MGLQKNEYKLYALKPSSKVFWINNMGVLYEWDSESKDMVKSSLEAGDLSPRLLVKTSTSLTGLVKIQEKEERNLEILSFLIIPKSLVMWIYYCIKFEVNGYLRKWRRKK